MVKWFRTQVLSSLGLITPHPIAMDWSRDRTARKPSSSLKVISPRRDGGLDNSVRGGN